MNVNFISPRSNNDGYGMTNHYFKKWLAKEGIILEAANAQNEITFINHIPPAIQHATSRIKVLYTMLEGDEVPNSWLPYLAQATHILVPTRFVKETFQKSGFDSTVIPLGYDPEVFTYVEREIKSPYTFLHYEAFQDRKGWQDLLNAWLESGLAEEEFDCQLILKTVKPIKEVYEKFKDYELPNVKVICGSLPHHALFDLLTSVDCFVFPSRGEGFSLPPIEAMATGLPTIISKAHSHLDYYNEEYMYGVDCEVKIPARYHNWEDQGNFVRCKSPDLATALKHVYDNKEEALAKGRKSAEYVRRYEYSNTAKLLKEFLCRIQ